MQHQTTWRDFVRAIRNASACIALAVSAAAPTSSSAAPYSGTPIALPATFEAENFDKGGEGVGYHDRTSGNTGGLYRTTEAVDIIASTDSEGGSYVVNNFQTDEWLAYTVSVAAAGSYRFSLRVSNNFSSSPAFHIEVDGVKATGSVSVPKTGSWDTFRWIDAPAISLSAGQHTVRIVADAQYFNLNRVRVATISLTGNTGGYRGTPFTGTPIAVPKAFEAEDFDKGGEGVAYHDVTAWNDGGQYRTSEGVDIVVSKDAAGGGYVVNHIQTGEWLAYTLNVPVDGNYDIAIRAANSGMAGAGFHAEIDGVNVTGKVPVSSTGSWNTFQWFGKSAVPLKAGTRVLKIVSDQQYFDLNQVSVLASGGVVTAPIPAPVVPVAIQGKGYRLVKNWDFVSGIRTPDAMYGEFYTRYAWDNGIDGPGSGDYIGEEWQRFRDNNNHVFEADGLALTARLPAGKTLAQGNIESGMLRSKWNGQYGYFEARVKVPKVAGAFPAFWLFSEDLHWPPEIDMMEIVNGTGNNGNVETTARSYHYLHPGNSADLGNPTYQNPAFNATWKSYTPGFDYAADYHTIAMEWTPTTVRNYVDDVLVVERPFVWRHGDGSSGGPAHVLLNYALGAPWPGAPTMASVPSKLMVQYMRVWQQ